MASTVVTVARVVGAAGLIGAGVLHAGWAAGLSWPAADRTALAEVVAGTGRMPGAPECAVVAVLTTGAGALVAGALGERPVAVLARRAAGVVLLGRAIVGGVATGRVLGMPLAAERFRALDNRYYRPLCATLGAAALVGARRTG